MHGVRREAASRVALATAPPANPRPSAGLRSERIASSKVVHGFEGHVREHGFGLNGICQRQGHTGVEREKEERRADRRTDRQTDWETHSWRCWWHLEQSHFSSGRFAGRAGNGLFLFGSEHGTGQRRRCLQPPADNTGLLFLRQAPKGGLPGAEPPAPTT